MIKVLIIEDELPARKKLRRFMEQISTPIEILAEIDTVEAAIAFLNSNKIDLIFSDIELLDGNAFEIFKNVTVNCPIIFTTAYDTFWMQAFDTNGISYLLKPFSQERFEHAWKKFLLFTGEKLNSEPDLRKLTQLIEEKLETKNYKKRFTIHSYQKIYLLETSLISYFEAVEGVVFACEATGKKHLLREATLKEIEEKLNPNDFFRINRSEIVHKIFLEKVERYSKNNLAIKVKGFDQFLKTSQSMTAPFRDWMDE